MTDQFIAIQSDDGEMFEPADKREFQDNGGRMALRMTSELFLR